MIRKNCQPGLLVPAILFVAFACGGCDALYRSLHKEGAQEREILGDLVAYEANPRVQKVQMLLKLYGYGVGTPDGKMGAHTRKAIAEFQLDNGLKVSRFIDRGTWDLLMVYERYGLVKEGELDYLMIQKALKAAGFDPGPADGKPGRRTDAAVKDFQKAQGLKADGKIGIRTLNELTAYVALTEDLND